MKNSFSQIGAVLRYSLPCDMREAKSLSEFKRLANLNFCILGIYRIDEKQVLVRLVDLVSFCILFRVVRDYL